MKSVSGLAAGERARIQAVPPPPRLDELVVQLAEFLNSLLRCVPPDSPLAHHLHARLRHTHPCTRVPGRE
jgi:hypothetical protein